MAKPKIAGIYEIVNATNGKRYVGSSVNIWNRWVSHRAKLRLGVHHCPPLQRAWDKHGEASFSLRVLAECPRGGLIEAEQRFIDELKPDYNVAQAAGYRTFLGLKHKPETLAKMAEAHKGNERTKGMKRCREAVEATASAHRGAKRSEETRKRISEARKGKKMPERSAEWRARLSASLKGKPKSPEHLAALQAGRAKRVYTEEQRAAISRASKATWARRKAQAST